MYTSLKIFFPLSKITYILLRCSAEKKGQNYSTTAADRDNMGRVMTQTRGRAFQTLG